MSPRNFSPTCLTLYTYLLFLCLWKHWEPQDYPYKVPEKKHCILFVICHFGRDRSYTLAAG